jgi:hypothetical protein
MGMVALAGQDPAHFKLQADTCSQATLSLRATRRLGGAFSFLSSPREPRPAFFPYLQTTHPSPRLIFAEWDRHSSERSPVGQARGLPEKGMVPGPQRQWRVGRMRAGRVLYLLRPGEGCSGHGQLDRKGDKEVRGVQGRTVIPGFKGEWRLGPMRKGWILPFLRNSQRRPGNRSLVISFW